MLPYYISKFKFPRIRLCFAQVDLVVLPEPRASPGQSGRTVCPQVGNTALAVAWKEGEVPRLSWYTHGCIGLLILLIDGHISSAQLLSEI